MLDTENKIPLESQYKCPKCNSPFHFQVKRSWFRKKFFPNSPIRRFFCARCLRRYYIKVDPDKLKKGS